MTLREQVFRKMGWKHHTEYLPGCVAGESIKGYWSPPDFDGNNFECCVFQLPPIDEQWEVTAKYLVPFMRLYEYNISGGDDFNWVLISERKYDEPLSSGYAEIKDDNIAEAACKAFMEVEL